MKGYILSMTAVVVLAAGGLVTGPDAGPSRMAIRRAASGAPAQPGPRPKKEDVIVTVLSVLGALVLILGGCVGVWKLRKYLKDEGIIK